jgi:hypothetical protein
MSASPLDHSEIIYRLESRHAQRVVDRISFAWDSIELQAGEKA